ncbi:hypothetical protein, partial [Candidatus Binatus sp.]|uniref:hypothetical protein n=1 Tax=Candidatus Binatus sp. TaxID=2811406 RepID=UPI003BB0C618
MRKFEQANRVADVGTAFADARRDLVMGQPEMVDQAEKRESFLDCVQIFTHDILDQRHLERGAIVE